MGPITSWLEMHMLLRRRRHRPRRIILVRHGESAGNLDKTLYQRAPDSLIPLTKKGFEQARSAGLRIRQLVGDESVHFFFSPYMRTRQTLISILKAFKGKPVQVTAEPRLREQDFGNFQDPQEMESVYLERRKFGRFYYRFPNGEAGTDVYDRVAEFWSTLYRFMDKPAPGWARKDGGNRPAENFVCVTHGLLLRIFCMCYFRWTVLEFEQVWNPGNCEAWVLERMMPSGRYRLAGALGPGGNFIPIKFGLGKRQNMYPHMKQPLASRKYTPGEVEDNIELFHLRVPGEVEDGAADTEYSLDGCNWPELMGSMMGQKEEGGMDQ